MRLLRFARNDNYAFQCFLFGFVFFLLLPLSAHALDAVGGPNTASGFSNRPSLSHDGTRVAFETSARLSADDTDKRLDVYVVDLPTGTPRRLPRSPSSAGAAGVWLSGDGQSIAYHVIEVAGKPDVQPLSIILLRDLNSDRVRRVPPGWFGLKADGEALYPVLGRTGRYLAFTSDAPGLAVKRDPPVRAVFLLDTDTDRIQLISRNAGGTAANRPSAEARLSQDGRFVAFLSVATNLDPSLPSNSLSAHLYIADRSSGTVVRVDTIERGFDPAEWLVGRFAMDDEANALVFEARQRKPGKPFDSLDSNDLFLFEASSGAVTRLTFGLFSGHSHSPALSGNGRWAAFVYAGTLQDPGGLVVYDHKRDLWRRVVEGRCANPVISGDGSRVAFESSDPKITGDKIKLPRVYVVDNPSYETEETADAGH